MTDQQQETPDRQARLERARVALEGLSVGDGFGERFFVNPNTVEGLIAQRALPAPVWYYTDDTEMALSLYAVLRESGEIDRERLAVLFARHYDIRRGYGPAMHGLLRSVGEGVPWQEASHALFEGQGSWGNGAAMRVAPLGAYFADDLERAAEQARLSAEVTHAHPEAAAGAVAVAVAAALAWRMRGASPPREAAFLDMVLPYVPASQVREKIRHARNLSSGCSVTLAVSALGNGTGVSAMDTVPFSLWCASRHLDDYEEALWLTVSGLGDRDTTCAIVGGIVASYTGTEGIPPEWRDACEPLPGWAFDGPAEGAYGHP